MSKDKIDTPSKEQILEAANDCPQAKDALTKLFPKAFEEEEEWRQLDGPDIKIGHCSGYFFLEDKKSTGTIGYIKTFEVFQSAYIKSKVAYDDKGKLSKILVKNK